jgi:hypothetical protein
MLITRKKDIMLEDIIPIIKSELNTTHKDLKTKLINIRKYCVLGMYILEQKKVMSIKGQDILKDNDFIRDLVMLMKTPTFKSFRKRYMKTEQISSFIYFEIYTMLDKFYKKKFKQDIPNDMAAELLRSIFQKKEYRTPLVKVLHDFVINGGKRRDLDEKLKTIMGFENLTLKN